MKNLVNLLLIFLFFFSFGMLEVKSTNITGATQNGNVFTVAPSHINSSGTTGFRQYSNFTLDQNHILNLQYQNNMNKFVNIVNNSVTINGILNTQKNGNFYNGNVIFITKGGFTVGANGVLNLGSLNVTTTNQVPNVDELCNLSDEALETKIDLFKSHMAHPISVSGKILAFEDVNLYGKSVTINSNARIVAGFNQKNNALLPTQNDIAKKINSNDALNAATIRISDIINTGNAKDLSNNYTFSSSKGKITIVSKSSLYTYGNIVSGNDLNIESHNRTIVSGTILVKNNININNDTNTSLAFIDKITIFDSGNFNIFKKNGKTHIQNTSNININQGDLKIIHIDKEVDKLSQYYNSLQINGKIILGNGDILITHDSPKSMSLDANTIVANNLIANNFNSLNIDTYSPQIFISNNTINVKNDINIFNYSSSKMKLAHSSILKANNINIYNGYDNKNSGDLLIEGTILAENDINIINNATGKLTITKQATIKSEKSNVTILGKKGSGVFEIIRNNIKAPKDLVIEHEDNIVKKTNKKSEENITNINTQIENIVLNIKDKKTNTIKTVTNQNINTYENDIISKASLNNIETVKILDINGVNMDEVITIEDLDYYNRIYYKQSQALYF